MKKLKGGITFPKGFLANGLACGIKKSRKPDLALIFSEVPAVTAGVFTTNSIKAAPVIISQKHIKNNTAQAIIVNSGNANCFTGDFGKLYARRTTELIGRLLNITSRDVLVASTGIIGKPLPFKKIENAAERLAAGLNKKGSQKAARAILTTDTVTKECAVKTQVGGQTVRIGGMVKGSGMIQPNMATMLAFIATDVSINKLMLKTALKRATEQSFNCLTVDGCMSTNDMVIVMANGAASNKSIHKTGHDYNDFTQALTFVCQDLAKQIILDAEGGTKFIEIEVQRAATRKQALAACFAIANSNLVKTAAFGNNPNWGRVAAAVGSLGIPEVTEERLKIHFSPFEKKCIQILVQLNIGKAGARVYTSDLSYEYVRINGEYN